MNDQAIRFRIGIFVLAGLIALAVLILLFGGLPNYFLPSTTYTIQFDNAPGVAAGTPVKRSGVKIGEVRRVTLDGDDDRVKVLIQIDDGHKLRKGDRPTLLQSVLGGDATIAFLPPKDKKDVDTTPVEPGAVIAGSVQADTSALLQRASDVIQPAEETLKEIRKTFETLTPAAERTLAKLDKTFDTLTPAAEKALAKLERLAPAVEAIEKMVPTIQGAFAKIDKLAPVVEKAVDKLTPLAEKALDKIDKLAPAAEKAFEKIDKLAGVVEKAVDRLTPAAEKALAKIDKLGSAAEKAFDKLTPLAEKALDKIDKLAPVVEKAFDKIDKLTVVVQKTVENVDKNILPDLRRTGDEIQLLARNWTKVGERVDLFMRTNEDKLVKTIEKAEEALKRVNEIFNDENQKNVRDTLKNIRLSSERVDAIAKNTDELLKESRATLKTFNEALVKVDRVADDLQKATKPLAERGESIWKNVDEATDKLNRTLNDVRDLLQSIARGDGSIQKLLSDPSLYNNLNDASLGLSRLMPRLDHVLHDVEIFADKIARHPEIFGIRGAIAPSSGLKESPSHNRGVFPSPYP